MNDAEPINWAAITLSHVTANEFVGFWQPLYSDSGRGYDEEFYKANIRQPLTRDRLEKWFEWKNGGTLSSKKKESLHRNLGTEGPVGKDNDLDDETLKAFLNKPGGTIWRIFWLHIQYPENFPIYDQHVHRAMRFLLKRREREISDNNPKKVRSYVDEYRPFFKKFAESNPRRFDQALWAFGRFLKSRYCPTVQNEETKKETSPSN